MSNMNTPASADGPPDESPGDELLIQLELAIEAGDTLRAFRLACQILAAEIREAYEEHGCPFGEGEHAMELWLEYGDGARAN